MSKLKKHTILLGISIIVIGFLYDLIFAGIPPQDASAKLMEKYSQNTFISDGIIKLGLFVTLIGIFIRMISSKGYK